MVKVPTVHLDVARTDRHHLLHVTLSMGIGCACTFEMGSYYLVSEVVQQVRLTHRQDPNSVRLYHHQTTGPLTTAKLKFILLAFRLVK